MFCFSQTYIKFTSFKNHLENHKLPQFIQEFSPKKKEREIKSKRTVQKVPECDSPFVYSNEKIEIIAFNLFLNHN